MEESKKYRLNWIDLKKIFKGALIAMLGAGMTYLAEDLKGCDFGECTPFVAGIVMILLNTGRKFLTGPGKEV